jgi:NTP pyrophosphatase (non-canonical NTP hydrolase)
MNKYSKKKKTRRELLTDLLVAVVCIAIIGGMIVYAHFDIVRIVNE